MYVYYIKLSSSKKRIGLFTQFFCRSHFKVIENCIFINLNIIIIVKGMKLILENNKSNFENIILYFTIFSVFGLMLETLYCYATTGVLESRKGLLIGPFCPIYGIGASIIILVLDKFRDKKIRLFVLGVIFGSIIEYLLSYALEAIYGNRFWDYNYLKYNTNGRISAEYSLMWGVLSVLVIIYIKPIIDKYLNRLKKKTKNKISTILLIFFIVNSLITCWGITTYKNRIINKTNDIINKFINKIEDKIFPNEIMKKVFPNLRFIDKNGNEIYIRDLINEK